VQLDGSESSDPDGTITSFAWAQKSGPAGAQIAKPNEARTAVTNLVQGTYVFELTVKDSGNLSATDEVSVIVLPAPNQSPTANAGADRSFNLGTTAPLVLDGSQSSDPDGTIVFFQWKQAQGPSQATIVQPDKAMTGVTNLAAGVYVFELTVKDDKGAAATDTVTITVVQPQPVKVCLPIGGVVEDFRKLPSVSPNAFPRFSAGFSSYWQVEQYFNAMSAVISSPVQKQLDFFSSAIQVRHPATGQQAEISIEKDLHRWIIEVFNFGRELPLIRLLALHLYRILVRLAMYIACIQREDIDRAKVPVMTVFGQVVVGQINGLSSGDFFGQLTTPEKAVFAALLNDFREEERRLKESGEMPEKKNYATILKEVIRALSTLV
jgi:hypothetical protein